MNHVAELIREYGEWFYLVTFIWTALEGETFVIFAAIAAQHDLLNIWILFFAAWFGSFAGDQLYFYLGRRYGTRMIKRWPKVFRKDKLDKVLGWLENNSTIFVLSYRFMYGIRNISGVAIGMSNLKWRKFAVLNFIAAFLWAVVFCGVGYMFGSAIEHLGNHAEDEVLFGVREFMILALVLFAVAMIWRARFVQLRQRKKAAEQAKVDLIAGCDNPGDRV